MKKSKFIHKNFRDNIIKVPTLFGRQRYINFDNAASTPPARVVWNHLQTAAPYYSNIHRGNGYKSLISSAWYDETKNLVRQFVGAGKEDCVIYTKNASESANLLANIIPGEKEDVALVGYTEHHSNLLPWQHRFHTILIPVNQTGELDLNALQKLIKEHQSKLKVIAVTAASNVTGILTPLDAIAKMAKAAHVPLAVDAAQLIAHHPINKKKLGIDWLFFSAHKMYAPFGTGVLIGPSATLEEYEPWQRGGGTIKMVTPQDVVWEEPPAKFEAGTPNILGAIALESAIGFLQEVGFDYIRAHEEDLINYLLKAINQDPLLRENVVFYGTNAVDRVSVVSFLIKDIDHRLTSAILNYEGGIGTRSGCFCAQPYVIKLLDVNKKQLTKTLTEIAHNDRRHFSGLVRLSFGLYNTREEIDRLLKFMKIIVKRKWRGKYVQNKKSGEFSPSNFDLGLEKKLESIRKI